MICLITAYVGRNVSDAHMYRCPKECTCIAFTSRETEQATRFGSRAESYGWKVVYLTELTLPQYTAEENQNLTAKQPKIMPHNFISKMYKHVVWLDVKRNVNMSLIKQIIKNSSDDAAAAMFCVHPFPHVTSAADEHVESMLQDRYIKLNERQLQFMNDQDALGFSRDYTPHYASTLIIHNMHNPTAAAFQNIWWDLTLAVGILCQLSLAYARQRFTRETVPAIPVPFDVLIKFN